MRILCVDDDEDSRELLEHLLDSFQLEAIAVQDSESALQLINQEKFSLYIIDSQLPGVSGFGLCEEIRRQDHHTPIIIFSAHGYMTDKKSGLSAGANVYIVKPDIEQIVPTVKRLLAEAATPKSFEAGE